MAAILPPETANLHKAVEILKNGGLVALPTETVYGLAANALDEAACRRIFEVKGRPFIDPLISHVLGLEQARSLAETTPEAEELMAAFWPGALTLVLPKKDVVPDIVTAGRSSVALRSPNHPVIRDVLQLAAIPLAAPSANPFGQLSPTRAEHVQNALGDRIPMIIDGGPCQFGIESTIVDMRNPDAPVLLRPGAISREELGQVLNAPLRLPQPRPHAGGSTDAATGAGSQLAPGMLERHYSPRTPLSLFECGTRPPTASGTGTVVLFQRPDQPVTVPAGTETLWLSEDGDTRSAASALFALLHELDSRGLDWIAVEKAPRTGLGPAINDRLVRASAK